MSYNTDTNSLILMKEAVETRVRKEVEDAVTLSLLKDLEKEVRSVVKKITEKITIDHLERARSMSKLREELHVLVEFKETL